MNEQQNTREAKREDDVVWGMYVDLDKPELLDKIWDRGFAAGAASVDRRAIVEKAFENVKQKVQSGCSCSGCEPDWYEAMDAVLASMGGDDE